MYPIVVTAIHCPPCVDLVSASRQFVGQLHIANLRPDYRPTKLNKSDCAFVQSPVPYHTAQPRPTVIAQSAGVPKSYFSISGWKGILAEDFLHDATVDVG